MKPEWKVYRADEFCSAVTDGTHDSPKAQLSGRYLITSKHLKGNRIDFASANKISEEDYQKVIKRSAVQQWDILYSMIGTIGNVYLEKNPIAEYACKNMGIFKFSGKKESAIWMYYYLQSPQAKAYIQSHLRGSTQAYVPLGSLRELPVLIPPREVRKQIVSILKSLDNKIELNQRINENLERQAQAIFNAWFVDFEPFGREKPATWDKATLGTISEITSGKRPLMRQAEKTPTVNIPLVGAASVMGFTNAALYDEKILVTGRVGTHGVIQRFTSKCWASDNTLVITSKFYEFVYQVLQTIDYQNMNRGSTQPLITQTDMKNIPIILPTTDILEKFEGTVGTLMRQYEENNRQNAKLAEIRNTLLPKLMAGEIDLEEA